MPKPEVSEGRRGYWELLVCSTLLPLLIVISACTNRSPRPLAPDAQRKEDRKEIERVLASWKKGMLEGDTKGVHALFSRRKAAELPLDKFEQWYRANSQVVLTMFGGIEIHQIAPEGNEATVLIRWGNGRLDMIPLVREEGKWKLDRGH